MAPRSRSNLPGRWTRSHLLLLLVVALTGLAGCPPPAPPPAREGRHPHEAEARVAVPGGFVAVAGGTLHLARRLLVIETRLGPLPVDGSYDSVAGGWRWSFELARVGDVFTDASGASFDLGGVADGAVVPGTDWVKLAGGRMKTRGGLVHEFDGAGRVSAVHWSSDAYPRLRYETAVVAAEVRIVAIEQCVALGDCSPVYDLAWDAAGRLIELSDRAGRRAELAWDAAGRLAAARDGGDVEAGFPGDRYGWEGDALVSLETSDGERVVYHQVGGRLAAVVAEGPGSPTWAFAYDRLADGTNRTRVDGPTGERRAFVWDDQRRLLRRTVLDLDESMRFVWDGLRIARREAPDGVAVERAWQDGWLVSESLPGGNVRDYAWNPAGTNRLDPLAGAPLWVSDAFGVVLSVAYDSDGRPVALTDGAGDTTQLAWDGIELVSVTRPVGPVQELEAYGEHGKPARIRVGGEVVDEPVYDAVGDRLTSRDLSDPTSTAMPGVIARSFDADRRVASLTLLDEDPDAPPTERTLEIQRRADGRVLRIERPYAGDTENAYDALGRRLERRERVDGVWQVTRFAYDAGGRPVSVEKPNGMGRTWSYDAAGRVARSTALRDGLVESVLTSTWHAGRLASAHDSVRDAEEHFLYDVAGRVEQVIHAFGESTELAYDARGRATEVTLRLPDGSPLRTLGMSYDGAGREVGIHDGGVAGPEILGRSYADGRLVETRYGNGLTRRYDFEEATGRWTGAVTTAADGSWVADTFVGVSASPSLVLGGTITRTADPLGLVPDPPPGSDPGEVYTNEAFLLDAGYGARPAGLRLRFMDLEGSFEFVGSTQHDALGNRRRVSQKLQAEYEVRTFAYNAERNRLLEARRVVWDGSEEVEETYRTYQWDEAGYATAVDGNPITWNAQGRIASVGGVASFVWDAAGRPVSRSVLGEETVHWFGGRLEAPAGELPRHLDLGEVRLDLADGPHRYRHFGPRRNVKFVTGAEGRVVAHHLYAGYRRLATYGPGPDARGFAGGTHAGGFVVLGARVLDPEAGRFLSPDPIEQLLDPYAYAWGNPLQLWDPSGLQAQPVPPGPPVSATVTRILGGLFLALGPPLVAAGPLGAALGYSSILLGAGLEALSLGIRDTHARRSGGSFEGGSLPPIPAPPAAGLDPTVTCIDGFCFAKPPNGPPRAPAPGVGGGGGGGAGAFGFDAGSSGCSSPGVCAAGAGPVFLLPWLLRLRRLRFR